MSSLINPAPAILILESAVIALVCLGNGYSLLSGIVISELLIIAQLLICEERWSLHRVLFAVWILLLCCFFSAFTAFRVEQREKIPSELEDDFIVAVRRNWGDNILLQLKDRYDRQWITVAQNALVKAQEGDRFILQAKVRMLKNESRRSSFSPLRYWEGRGVCGELHEVKVFRQLPEHFSVHSLRRFLRERILRLPELSRALFSAVLLGDRDANISEDFRRWGISHFLAVSGWHVGFAVAIAALIAGRHRWGIYAATCLLWLYCLISGMSSSAVRAAIMLQSVLLGLLLGAGTCGLNSVGIAGVFMLVVNPKVCYDLGWQLSVLAAVAAVGLQRLKNVWLFLLTSPLMWMISSPLVSPLSGGIYLSSLPNNIMASALFSFVLAFVLLAGSPVLLGAGAAFLPLCAEKFFSVWAAAADQWVAWLPQAFPAGFFPIWFCGGALAWLTASALNVTYWRAALLGISEGLLLYLL